MKKLLITSLSVSLLSLALARDVKLSWYPNSEQDIAGYYLYSSTNYFDSGATNKLDVGIVTNTTFDIDTNINTAFRLTAFNTSGLESDFSNEIRFELLSLDIYKTNSFTLEGFTNWHTAELVQPPTNGVLVGTPPNLSYYCTNFDSIKDGFTYTVQKKDILLSGTNKLYTVLSLRSNITVDGNLSEWTDGHKMVNPVFYIPKGNGTNPVIFETYSGGTWTGTNDHSITFKVAWRLLSLYIGIVVRDDYHEHSGVSVWNGDSVQLLFTDRNRTSIVSTINCAINGVEGNLGNLITTFSNTNAPNPTISIVRDSVNKITTYEMEIDATYIGLMSLSEGTEFGLGICVNDGDETEIGQKGWSGFGPHAVVFGQSPSEAALFRVADEYPVRTYYTIDYIIPEKPIVPRDLEIIRF